MNELWSCTDQRHSVRPTGHRRWQTGYQNHRMCSSGVVLQLQGEAEAEGMRSLVLRAERDNESAMSVEETPKAFRITVCSAKKTLEGSIVGEGTGGYTVLENGGLRNKLLVRAIAPLAFGPRGPISRKLFNHYLEAT